MKCWSRPLRHISTCTAISSPTGSVNLCVFYCLNCYSMLILQMHFMGKKTVWTSHRALWALVLNGWTFNYNFTTCDFPGCLLFPKGRSMSCWKFNHNDRLRLFSNVCIIHKVGQRSLTPLSHSKWESWFWVLLLFISTSLILTSFTSLIKIWTSLTNHAFSV